MLQHQFNRIRNSFMYFNTWPFIFLKGAKAYPGDPPGKEVKNPRGQKPKVRGPDLRHLPWGGSRTRSSTLTRGGSRTRGIQEIVKFDKLFHFLVSPAGNFSKKAHERRPESTSEAVLWAFHTNFFSRTQPWPREPPKNGHLWKFKVSNFSKRGIHKKWPDIAPVGLSWGLPHKVGCDSKESGHEEPWGGPQGPLQATLVDADL